MRRLSLLVHLLVVLGLTLPVGLDAAPFSTAATGLARVAGPEVNSDGADQPVLVGKRAKVKQDRRQDRRKDAQQDRKKTKAKQDRKRGNRTHGSTDSQVLDEGQGPVVEGPVVVADVEDSLCQNPESAPADQTVICTHGPDPMLPGDTPSELLSAEEAAAEIDAAAIGCDGADGVSGNRVRALYVYATGSPNNSVASLPTILAGLATTDVIYRTSSAQTGPVRSVRFYQNPTTCLPVVDTVQIPSVGSFSAIVTGLKNQGATSTDRIYLSFIDGDIPGLCGQGGIEVNDGATAANPNNTGPQYSIVGKSCWNTRTPAHEVMHNLGGVQLSAPNTSKGFHCVDEWDVMCYSDDPFYPTMRTVCTDTGFDTTILDCNHDDYFNTNPAPGSYLATHWNPANNQFLTGSAPLPPPPPPPPPPPTVTPVTTPTYWYGGGGHKKKHKHKKKH